MRVYRIEHKRITGDYRNMGEQCAFRNTRVKLAVTLLKDDGESTIDGPHYEHGDEENAAIAAYLMDTLLYNLTTGKD